MRDPFRASKRQWKRYDPEPPKKDNSLREWELYVWTLTVIVAIYCIGIIASHDAHPVDAKQRTVPAETRAHR